MAQLIVGVAVNAALGLALNALFPPPDIEQEGPRLNELGYTSAAYGKFVNITFGTDRMGGNVIDSQDPVIEEVIKEETESVGKGGGQDITTTTFSYFLTGRVAFAVSGATALVRLWGDGKLIFDATSDDQQLRDGVNLTFYPGGPDQLADSEEVNREGRGASLQPAYRHLTSIKFNRLPLADYGNRIPNFTAEISFNSNDTNTLTEATGIPGGTALPGGNAPPEHIYYDYLRDAYYMEQEGGDGFILNGDMSFRTYNGGGTNATNTTNALDGFIYGRASGIFGKYSTITGQLVDQIDLLTAAESVDPPGQRDSGRYDGLKTTIPGVGVFHSVFHMSNSGGQPTGSIIDVDNMKIYHLLTPDDGAMFQTNAGWDGNMVADDDRSTMIMFQEVGGGNFRPIRFQVSVTFGPLGPEQDGPPTFTVNNDISFSIGPAQITGWAVNRTNGDIILTNEDEIILYNPYSDTVLARRSEFGVATNFRGENNYFTGDRFGWLRGSSNQAISFLRVIDTRTLEDIYFQNDLTEIIENWGSDSSASIQEEAQVWDDRRKAIVVTRTVNSNMVRVNVGRVNTEGVGLDFVVGKLCTSYQGIEMAGMDASEFDASELSSDSVLGYTINNRSTIRSAMQPLRDRFFFDAVEQDWQVAFRKRGSTPVVTIPEEFVGELKRPFDPSNPPVVETRTQDIELPMRFNIRYRNRDADYDPDVDGDKRQRQPTPTMSSKLEKTLDIPIVDVPANIKPIAQDWLWTLWNERKTVASTIPWRYLQLTPADVVNVGLFGETLRLRMSEIDVGATLFMGFTGIQENSFQFGSTLPAGSGLGRPTNNIPSSLPTELFFLDAPILSEADFSYGSFSNSYAAVRGFDASWPGAAIVRSEDGVNFSTINTLSTQAAVAAITSPPPAMEFVDGNPTNRFVDASMTIAPVNRSSAWETATELDVLNGANTVAVIYADGSCQILQFQNVTDNGNGTFTLQKLLLGRLGTEDVAATAPAAGDFVVLLANSTNVREINAIAKSPLALNLVNTPLTYKAVTTGTLLEDADTRSFTYTGRDQRPFAPVHVTASFDVDGNLTVNWVRRTRGPTSGELLDGTGEVPLNESFERYEVTAGSVTKTVDDATTVVFTAAEINSTSPTTGWLSPDGSFPLGQSLAAYTLDSGDAANTTLSIIDDTLPADNETGTGALAIEISNSDTSAVYRQDVDLSTLGIADATDYTFFLSWQSLQDRVEGNTRVQLQLLTAADSIIAEVDSGDLDPTSGWTAYGSTSSATLGGVAMELDGGNSLVTKLRLLLHAGKGGLTADTDVSRYDEITLEAQGPNPSLSVDVVQLSETGLKSPSFGITV